MIMDTLTILGIDDDIEVTMVRKHVKISFVSSSTQRNVGPLCVQTMLLMKGWILWTNLNLKQIQYLRH